MPIRILLVDSNDQFRAAVRRFLEEATDLQVVGSVGDGSTAVQQAQALKLDLVLTEI